MRGGEHSGVIVRTRFAQSPRCVFDSRIRTNTFYPICLVVPLYRAYNGGMNQTRSSSQTKSRLAPGAHIFALIGVGICALTLAFVSMIFAARALGNGEPPATALAPLHLTDCAFPCWMGITPGKTRFDEALQQMNAAFPHSLVSITGGRIINLDTSFGQVLLTGGNDGVIHRISLPSFRLKGVLLGDIVGLLGMPTWIVGVNPTAIYYGCETYEVAVSGGTVSGGWRQRIVIIDIQDVGYPCPSTQQ